MATPARTYHNSPPAQLINPGELLQLATDLEELCALGFLEAFRDEHNVVRYRPADQVNWEKVPATEAEFDKMIARAETAIRKAQQ